MDHLQDCLNVLSEQQLRDLVLRLAIQDAFIHDVFVMELEETLRAFTDEDKIPLSQRPEPSCHHHTKPSTLSNSPVPDSDQEEFTYHPGTSCFITLLWSLERKQVDLNLKSTNF